MQIRIRTVIYYNQKFQIVLSTETDEVNIQSYIPFYVLYYVLMGLHAQFTQTALGVARRYRRLNMALQSAFTLSKFSFHIFQI